MDSRLRGNDGNGAKAADHLKTITISLDSPQHFGIYLNSMA